MELRIKDCDFAAGKVLLIDKPYGWTSFDVVAKVRNLIRKYTGQKVKVGHSGTLDPLATGLMVLGTGKKTKFLSQAIDWDKEYIATIEFGKTTPSLDAGTEVERVCEYEHIDEELVRKTVEKFLGKQMQLPPKFSAKKVGGRRAYSLARRGQEVELKPVEVHFFEIEILELNLPKELKLRLLVSKGTYIRAFVRDFAEAMGSCAYLTGLVRTKVGPYKLEEAIGIKDFEIELETKCKK